MMKKLFLFLVVLMLSSVIFVGAEIDTNQIPDYEDMSKEEINQFIRQNLDQVDLSQAPSVLKFVLGKPKINTIVEMVDGEVYKFGFVVVDDEIADFVDDGHEEPNYSVIITEQTLLWIANSEDPQQAASDAYIDEFIVVKAHSFGSKVKLSVFGKLYKWFG
jgi:hypothetical protein